MSNPGDIISSPSLDLALPERGTEPTRSSMEQPTEGGYAPRILETRRVTRLGSAQGSQLPPSGPCSQPQSNLPPTGPFPNLGYHTRDPAHAGEEPGTGDQPPLEQHGHQSLSRWAVYTDPREVQANPPLAAITSGKGGPRRI